MKQKLLLALLALFTGVGNLFAQNWTPQAPADGDFYLYNVGTGKFLSCGESYGTKAVVGNGALKLTLANNGSGAYTLYTTSTFSYGNPNSAQLQSSGFVDQSVNATTWTFTAVDGLENTFTLLNAEGKYLCAPSDGTIIIALSETLPTDAYGYWKLINYDNLFNNATVTNPVDVTCLIGDANFESSNGTMTGLWSMNASNKNLCGGASPNKCAESYRSTFSLSQVLNNVPNGDYELTAQGFYRQDGSDNEHLPVFFINEKTSTFPLRTGTEGSMDAASASFSNGSYTISPIRVTVGDGKITLGAKLEGNTMLWCIWDNFTLKYYGIDLSAYEAQISALRSTLEGLKDSPMNTTVKSSVETALSETASVAQEQSAMEAAIAQLNKAIEDANTSIKNYAAAKAYLDKASTLDEAGQASYAANETVASVRSAYDDATLEVLTDEQKAAMDAAIIVAAKAQTTIGSDWTLVIVNPSFENGFASGWTNNGMDIQNNTSFPKDGNNYCEKWQPNGTVKVSQVISDMPAGVYKLTVKAKTRGISSAKFFASDISVSTKIADEVNTYSIEFACDANANITIGFEGTGTGAGNSWIALDDFHLTLVSAGLPDVTAVTGKMNAEVDAAQTAAIEAYNENKTVDNYNKAVAAIAAAQTSVDAYTVAATAVAKAKAIKENHNLASAEAAATFAEAIAGIENPYNEGTLADDNARNAGTTLGTGVSGWHGNNNAAAVVYLRDGYSLGDFEADPALHVNTWSTEGDNDGSGFSVPFYESWTPNSNSLATNTWTGSLSNLPTGLYKVSAWVRVQVKDGTTVADATGITMDVNGGTAVDVTEGTQVGETQFQLATYEAEGLVKDGNLTVNFNIAADNNISWLSFQNVKYEKVRDLTPEEQAVVPTGITLDETEVALDATTSTKTFTLTFTPENAEKAVSWESSDASVATVADGVVTAVSSGTATITVKSTLDENVSASATVTVSFPETEVASDDYVNEGAKRTVVSYGDNLIKNGAFEYPNSFYGWTTGSGVAMSADNFDLITEENNHYIKAKGHTGATGVNSIGTEWAIEAGKTYVFGYQVKSTSAGNSEFHVVSLTNELGTETSKISENSTAVGTDWTNVKYKFTNTDNYAYVQFRARWLNSAVSFDNFYLVEVVDEEVIGNVQYALDAIPTANIGENAFQYSQEAIDAANALVQGTATVEDVENAYAAVTTINAPAEGQLFNVVLTYNGWTYDNKAMTYIANGRTDAGNYNIQYKEEANKNLAQAFTFTKVEGNNYKMSQIDADGVARYITTGVPYGGNTAQIRTTTDETKALAVTVIPTVVEGKWNLRNTEANQFIGSQDAGVYTVNSHIDFVLQETQKPSIDINTTAAGWGTTILPFAAQKPADVKVYSCAEMSGSDLVLTEVEALEANKPYIIEGAWNETLTGDAQGTQLNYVEGLLTGVYAQTQAAAGTYVMQKLNGNVAFYKVSEEKPINVPANRAYLTGVNSEAKVLNIGNGETNGINAIQALIDGDAEIFNVNGVKQNTLQKGINIIKMSNGETRKIMVK